jgi:hypothetical protein
MESNWPVFQLETLEVQTHHLEKDLVRENNEKMILIIKRVRLI